VLVKRHSGWRRPCCRASNYLVLLRGWAGMCTDSLELLAAKRLLDAAKAAGFAFCRIAPGEGGPLAGRRKTIGYPDDIYSAASGTPVQRGPAAPLVAGGGRRPGAPPRFREGPYGVICHRRGFG
jgi:hypothetical protein